MKKVVFLSLIMSFLCVDAMSAIKVKKSGGGSFSGDTDGVVMGHAIQPAEVKSDALGSTETKSSDLSGGEPTFDGLKAEIAQLEETLAEKQAGLEACAQKNQNFKVAGIAALSLTGAGVAGTVYLNQKNKKLHEENDKLSAEMESGVSNLEKSGNGTLNVLQKSDSRVSAALREHEECMKGKGWTETKYEKLKGDAQRLSQKIDASKDDNDVALIEQTKKISDDTYRLLSATEKCEKETKKE